MAVFPGIPALLYNYDEIRDNVSNFFPLTAKILNQNGKVDFSYDTCTVSLTTLLFY